MTRLGWVVISPGQESSLTSMFSKTSVHDYKTLCSLDVLGVREEHVRRDEAVYDEFKKQLSEGPEGWYESNLFWKEKHPPLDTNKSGRLGRLNSLLHNRKCNDQFHTYNDTIRDQQENGTAKISSKNLSLDECLETGSPLQNLIWNILARLRFRPILLCGDIEKVFLQIRIRECERDLLRFHWVDNLESKIIEILRFTTRLVFGLTQSPFTLEGTL